MADLTDIVRGRDIVVVANRLPVDRVRENGRSAWRVSPGGLVSAMEPIVRELGCVWVGWAGAADETVEPFEHDSMRLVPVRLSAAEVEHYYEGFSNATLWPLYHDVTAQPEFHRATWKAYRNVNQRFAEAVADAAPQNSIVWVHDYQLQLLPRMLRESRPDLTIAFFLHIPFPARRLFAQLPWRREIVHGLLGADVVGFQRVQDARSFRSAAERYGDALPHGNMLVLSTADSEPHRTVLAQEFPISIDVRMFEDLASDPRVIRRAHEIRQELGDPDTVLLGVDRLDYTKGIRHRLKAFSELLSERDVESGSAVLVQVASPSRERVEAYRQLRDEIETTVGRINGEHGSFGTTPVVYLHQGFSRDEMAALYLAADVAVVSSLRDGMNLVAKEYVACRTNDLGVLVLSEFAGAADELRRAVLINPHDIDQTKAALLRAMHMPENEQRRRMRALRRIVAENDVRHWAQSFLLATAAAADRRQDAARAGTTQRFLPTGVLLSSELENHLRWFATAPRMIVACDFDGTLAPIVDRPEDARILERAQLALDELQRADGVQVVILTGRSLDTLSHTGIMTADWVLSGSHGSEFIGLPSGVDPHHAAISDTESTALDALERRLNRMFEREPGVRLERKPFGIALHTRQVRDAELSDDLLEAAARVGTAAGFSMREGKRVREFSLRTDNKGDALRRIRAALPQAPVLFFGDDVTDEDVFRSLEVDDLGVKVGPGDTAAHERVSTPEAVGAALALLVELRTGIVIGSESNS